MILYCVNLLISSLLMSLDYTLSPSLHLLRPSLTCALMFNILILILWLLLGLILDSKRVIGADA